MYKGQIASNYIIQRILRELVKGFNIDVYTNIVRAKGNRTFYLNVINIPKKNTFPYKTAFFLWHPTKDGEIKQHVNNISISGDLRWTGDEKTSQCIISVLCGYYARKFTVVRHGFPRAVYNFLTKQVYLQDYYEKK